MDIPVSMMPEVVSSSEVYGHTKSGFLGAEVPIGGIAGDQQAALFGQMCLEVGMVKNTYGTGCFILMNTGNEARVSENKLLTTIAWQIGGKTTYALEGSIFMAGAVIQWLRDGLGIIKNAADVEKLAGTVSDNGGLYFVPSFTGMGAPYWDQYARGLMIGLSRGTTAAHIARAALEGIAFQNMDVLKLMEKDAQINIRELRVDGGASASDLLMQFQADLLGLPVVRPQITESTAMGAAYLAGLSTGFWENVEEIRAQWKPEKEFTPNMPPERAIYMKSRWAEAVKRARNWEAE
jgi:glycerol kinase